MKRSKYILLLFIVIGALYTAFPNEDSVMAKTIVDDEGQTVDLPDSDFLNVNTTIPKYDENSKDSIFYYFNHLDEPFQGKMLINAPDGYSTMREYMTMEYKRSDTHFSSLEAYISSLKTRMLASKTNFMGLNTEGMRFGGGSYAAILKPSNITVYNETKQDNVKRAIQKAMDGWSRNNNIGFSFVDNPKEARIIVRGVNSSDNSLQFEQDIDALYQVTSTYYGCLLQGEIIVSPRIQSLPTDDPILNHSIVHEFGHVLGVPDLYWK